MSRKSKSPGAFLKEFVENDLIRALFVDVLREWLPCPLGSSVSRSPRVWLLTLTLEQMVDILEYMKCDRFPPKTFLKTLAKPREFMLYELDNTLLLHEEYEQMLEEALSTHSCNFVIRTPQSNECAWACMNMCYFM